MKRTVSILALITLFFLAVSLIIFPLINRHYDNENGMKIVVINRIIAEARTAVANGNAVTIDLDAYRREYEKRAPLLRIHSSISFLSNRFIRSI